jgi:hypothetical protein
MRISSVADGDNRPFFTYPHLLFSKSALTPLSVTCSTNRSMVVSNTTEGSRNHSMVVSNDLRGEGSTKARPNDKAPHKVESK